MELIGEIIRRLGIFTTLIGRGAIGRCRQLSAREGCGKTINVGLALLFLG